MIQSPAADMYGGWKQIIDDDLEPFFELFFPDAFATLVQLRKIEAQRDAQRRYECRLDLAERLYQAGLEREDGLKRLRFMDFILQLPQALAIQYRRDIDRIEEEKQMPYMTSMERLAREEGLEEGIEKGIEKGVLRGQRDLIRQTIEVRFGQVPERISSWLDQCTALDALRTFHRCSLEARSLEDRSLEDRSLEDLATG